MQITARIGAVRTALQNRRTERIERRQLADELALFVSPAERAELDFIMDRHTAEETREIRQILNSQQVARQHAHTAGLYRGR
nr:hypothetical protein [uncultured bacterium]